MKKQPLTKKEAKQIKQKIKELKRSLKNFKQKKEEKEVALVEQLELWDTQLKPYEKPYEKAYKKAKKKVKNDKKAIIILKKLSNKKKKIKEIEYALAKSKEKKKEKEAALMEQLEQWDTQLKPYEIAFKKVKKKVRNRKKSIAILEKLLRNRKKTKKSPSKSKSNENREAIPAAAKTTSNPIKENDLKKIEGIGPKIEAILKSNRIRTFRQLAEISVKQLNEILHAAGNRFKMHQPDSWPEQAALAANGKWKDLQLLQDKLNGGRKN